MAYLQRLRSGAAQRVDNPQELVTQLKQRYENFYNSPANQRSKAAIGFVKDYWDLVAAVLAGMAIGDADGKLLGYSTQVVGPVAGIATALGAVSRDSELASDRFLRNVVAMMATHIYQQDEAIIAKVVAGIYALVTIGMELPIRRRKREILKSREKSLLLENRVSHSRTF